MNTATQTTRDHAGPDIPTPWLLASSSLGLPDVRRASMVIPADWAAQVALPEAACDRPTQEYLAAVDLLANGDDRQALQATAILVRLLKDALHLHERVLAALTAYIRYIPHTTCRPTAHALALFAVANRPRRAEPRGITLRYAALTHADLRGAKFCGADLTGADLTGANLSWSRLDAANLTRANLTGADLTGANLAGANLAGTDFTDARLDGARVDTPSEEEATAGQRHPGPVQPARDENAIEQLVRRAREGDSDAFGQLYDHYSDTVYRYVYYRVGSKATAEDLTSETFLRALRRIGSFTGQGRDFGAWLVTIGRNLVADHLGSSRFRLEVTSSEIPESNQVEPSPEDSVLESLSNAALLAAVRRLDPQQQECVTLRFLQGLSVAETARIMERKEKIIKDLQYQAVRRLAQILPTDVR